jgi:hypothetical protein
MPVAPEIRRAGRNHHQMTGAGTDFLMASRAEVRLARLVRVDLPDLDLAQRGMSAHSRMAAITTNAAATIT